MRKRLRISAGLTVFAALLTFAVSCSGGGGRGPAPAPNPASAPPSQTAASAPLWIVAGSTLTRLLATDSAAATGEFNTPNAFVLTPEHSWAIPDGWTSTPTADFTSYSALRSALDGGKLDPRIKAVLYDSEQWSLTPSAEQHDPGRYYKLAGELVHRHHLLFIAAPATDLVNVLSKSDADAQGRYPTFLSLSLPADAARYADVLDIQAQGSEADTALFTSFVSQAAAQARSANPNIRILAGLSTNPSGKSVTTSVIETAARAVRPQVDGYWLNDPAASTACPRCAGPFPQIALAAVQNLTHTQGSNP